MLPEIRRPPGPRNERATDDTKPTVTRAPPPKVAAAPKTGSPTTPPSPERPGDRRGAGGVDRDDREVAVRVDAADLAARRSPVAERDGDLAATKVVGVGQDLAVGDDDAGPAAVATDPHDRRSDALGDRGDRRTELFDGCSCGLCSLPVWERVGH